MTMINPSTRPIGVAEALENLVPGSKWYVENNEYDKLTWLEPPVEKGGQQKPTQEEIESEIARLQKQWEDTEYQRLRAKEYPDIKEYLDGIVKGDQEQIQAYIDACIAVKEKYPKSE